MNSWPGGPSCPQGVEDGAGGRRYDEFWRREERKGGGGIYNGQMGDKE